MVSFNLMEFVTGFCIGGTCGFFLGIIFAAGAYVLWLLKDWKGPNF